mmetsp:Transcript_31151/g.89006  ORF Transcript_31151/g.89006 Transcript_31151/m.89006 type:complete len:240 (+) Transcript_31151:214-933(+)
MSFTARLLFSLSTLWNFSGLVFSSAFALNIMGREASSETCTTFFRERTIFFTFSIYSFWSFSMPLFPSDSLFKYFCWSALVSMHCSTYPTMPPGWWPLVRSKSHAILPFSRDSTNWKSFCAVALFCVLLMRSRVAFWISSNSDFKEIQSRDLIGGSSFIESTSVSVFCGNLSSIFFPGFGRYVRMRRRSERVRCSRGAMDLRIGARQSRQKHRSLWNSRNRCCTVKLCCTLVRSAMRSM